LRIGIANKVIAHLAGIIGADVKVTIEIDAFIPSGATEQVFARLQKIAVR